MAQQTGSKKGRGSGTGAELGASGTDINRPEQRVTDPIGAADPALSATGTGTEQWQGEIGSFGNDREKAGGFKGFVRDTASAQLENQKQRATEGLGNVVNAVRKTTDQLRSDGQNTFADYVQQAANQIDRFASGLRDKDLDEIVDDVQRFARRQPALFLGGAFALGFLGARFLKSSRDETDRSWRRDYDDYRRQAYGERRFASYGTEAYGSGSTSSTYGGSGSGSYGAGSTSGDYGAGSASSADRGSATTGYGTTDPGNADWTTSSTPPAGETTEPRYPRSPITDVER